MHLVGGYLIDQVEQPPSHFTQRKLIGDNDPRMLLGKAQPVQMELQKVRRVVRKYRPARSCREFQLRFVAQSLTLKLVDIRCIETTQAQRGRDSFLDIFIEIQANE